MATQFSNGTYNAPLHVCVGVDGTVRIFMPDGGSISLTADAAARSSALLSKAVAATRTRRHVSDEGAGNVIAADFSRHARPE